MKLTLYVDIDSFLDVRYGKLVQANPKLKDEVLFKFNQYCSRDHDNMWLLFPELSKEDWESQVVTKETLKLSRRTNVFNLIDDVLRSIDGSLAEDTTIDLLLNLGGWDFTEEEVEAFTVLTSARYEHRLTVRSVNLPLKDVTPTWLKANVNIAIMYNYNDWVDIHHGNLTNHEINSVTFYIPTLFNDKVEAERNFYAEIKKVSSHLDGDPLEIISDYVWDTYQINLYFVSNRFFSPIGLA